MRIVNASKRLAIIVWTKCLLSEH